MSCHWGGPFNHLIIRPLMRSSRFDKIKFSLTNWRKMRNGIYKLGNQIPES